MAREGIKSEICCPAHHDRSPSCSVGPGREPGLVLIECHRGCRTNDVLAAAGMTWSDLFPPSEASSLRDRRANRYTPKPKPPRTRPPFVVPPEEAHGIADAHTRLLKSPGLLTEAWTDFYWSERVVRENFIGYDGRRWVIPYLDRDATPIFAVRYLPGGRPKLMQPKGITRPLYGAELLPDVCTGRDLYVVEGEKAALAVRSEGYACVGIPGAKGWYRQDADQIARAGAERVVLWADNDEPGRRLMELVRTDLVSAGFPVERIKRWSWPDGTAPKADANDYLVAQREAGHAA